MDNIPQEKITSLDLLMQFAHGKRKILDSAIMTNLLKIAESNDLISSQNLPRIKSPKKELAIT